MATTNELYPDQVDEFERDWYRFRGMLTEAERENWDILVDRAKNRPYLGACQLASEEADPKWPIVFTMLVTQQAEIGRLRAELHGLKQSESVSR